MSTECLRGSLAQAMDQRELRQEGVAAKLARKEPSPCSYTCTAWQLMPEDDFVWFLARNNSQRGTERKSPGTSTHCSFCGNRSKAKEMSCVVTMQCDSSIDSCRVFMAESPLSDSAKKSCRRSPWPTTRTSQEAMCVLESPSDDTTSKLADVWRKWWKWFGA